MKTIANLTGQAPEAAATLLSAARRAAVCEEFMRLTREGHYTVTGAARALGRSPSTFSGSNSLVARYQRGGLAALERQYDGQALASELTRRIEGLVWFVPAASFFYLSGRTRRGALGVLARAVRRAVALPELPLGWSEKTRVRFLKHLGMSAPPECPAWLRKELQDREAAGKRPVPPRIARLIAASPSLARKHQFELKTGELVSFPFLLLAQRLAELKPGSVCLLTLDLL